MQGLAQRLVLKQRQKETFIHELLTGAFDYFHYCEAESGNTPVKELLRKTAAQVARGHIRIHLSLSVV